MLYICNLSGGYNSVEGHFLIVFWQVIKSRLNQSKELGPHFMDMFSFDSNSHMDGLDCWSLQQVCTYCNLSANHFHRYSLITVPCNLRS